MIAWKKTEQDIVENITSAEVAHFVESGMYVNKKRGWFNLKNSVEK
jgi:hypothetical protein